MGFLSRFFGWRSRPALQPKDVVTFDETAIFRKMPDGRAETVTWAELQKVAILTTDEGPAADDVFWILSGDGRGCAIPSESKGMNELMPRLQTLPGFDNEAVVRAMGSTDNATFICWNRPYVPKP